MWKSARHLLRHLCVRVVIGIVPIAIYSATASHLPLQWLQPDTHEIMETAAIEQSPTTIGITDPQLYGMSQADIDTTLNALQSIGVQDIRIGIPWAAVEPAQGSYDWTALDQVVNSAAARGMGVLADIASTPVWAGLPLSGHPDPAVFGAFAGQVAARYAGEISAYEIWNEPNAIGSWNPVDPVAYTSLLQAAYPAIKSADPSATVVAGVLAPIEVSIPPFVTDPVTFVQQMYQAGAKGFFDALSFHPYGWATSWNVLTGALGLFSQGASTPGAALNKLINVRQVMVANGDSSKLIWGTEYGQQSSLVGELGQAEYISDLFNTWKTYNYTGPVFIETAQDEPLNLLVSMFGIFRTDWTAKPAANVIQEAIAGQLPPTPPPPTPLAALADLLQSWRVSLGEYFSASLQAFNSWLGTLFGAPTLAPITAAAPATFGMQAVTSTAANLNAVDPPAASVAADVQQPVTGSGVQGAVVRPATEQQAIAASSSESTTTGQTPPATASEGTVTADSGTTGNTAGTTTPGTTGTTTTTVATGTTTTTAATGTTTTTVATNGDGKTFHGTGVPSGTSEGTTAATASGTAAGSATAASSKTQTPSGNSSASRAATSVARRVLPTPPTPVKVTSR
jgi:polysaccharide biosynthesis protein PslG